LIGKTVALGRGKVQGRELQREYGIALAQGQCGRVFYRGLQHIGVLGLPRFDGLVKNLEVGNHHARCYAVLAYFRRHESGDAVETAEVQRAIGCAHGRAIEIRALDSAIRPRVIAYQASARIQARQPAIGTEPEVARIIGQNGCNRVIGKTILAQIRVEADAAILALLHAVQARGGAHPDRAVTIFIQVMHFIVAQAAGIISLAAEVAELARLAVEQIQTIERSHPHAACRSSSIGRTTLSDKLFTSDGSCR
jgi:hypothetical protein